MRTLAAVFVFALLAAAILAAIPAPAQGQCYTPSVVRQRSYSYSPVYSYDYPVVVEKVVKKVVVEPVAVAVAIPAYFAAYVPPVALAPAAAPAHPCPPSGHAAAPSSEMAEVLRLMRGFDDRLKAVESRIGGPPAPPAPPAPPPGRPDPFAPAAPKAPANGMSVLQNKCASCHEAKVSAEKGGMLTLLDGVALAGISERDKRRVMSASYAGRMPPKTSGIPALTDDEVGAIVAMFDR